MARRLRHTVTSALDTGKLDHPANGDLAKRVAAISDAVVLTNVRFLKYPGEQLADRLTPGEPHPSAFIELTQSSCVSIHPGVSSNIQHKDGT